MQIEPGMILCLKLTGELVMVLGTVPEGTAVRRPISGRAGISHSNEVFQDFELETIEAHYLREANDMVLKIKAQNVATEKIAEMDAEKRKSNNPMVN